MREFRSVGATIARKRAVLEPVEVTFVGTYPPRRCGIGTFSHDLAEAVSQLRGEGTGTSETVRVVALTNGLAGYDYGPEVQFEIQDQQRMDYQDAADFLNLSKTEVVCLQHEFGIFGGDDGVYILDLLDNLTKPVVTTLHTVPQKPTEGQLKTLRSVCSRSALLVVMAQKAIELLVEIYNVPREKMVLIHHGAPDIPFLDPAYTKDQFEAKGRRVVLTFGLLNPNKGIEVAIEAMSSLAQEFSDLLYIVLGATHPVVKQHFGEEYRLSLERLVKHNGLERHVAFYNHFVSLEQLIQFLVAADIYLTPYLSKEQITSGTLAYAIACGKAIISTPYWYAEELLGDNRGCLVPFSNPDALANQLRRLLNDETERDALRMRAYQFGRQMVWREVGGAYSRVFRQALQERRRPPGGLRIEERTSERPSLPEIRLDHLQLLTDDTGILQHAVFSTPDRRYGYTTDDNARAAVVVARDWELFKNDEILPLLQRYLSFLNYALDEKSGRVRNFMSYDRRFTDEIGSEDSHARTVWALGTVVSRSPNDSILGLATQMFQQAFPACESFTSPRAWAYSVLGSINYLQRFSGDRETQRVFEELAQRLLKVFVENGSSDWPWGEDIVSYDNGRLPQALIAAGHCLNRDDMCQQGLRSLDWLLEIQTDLQEQRLSLIGSSGWFERGGERARFDQQPTEVPALIDACYEAYLLTREKRLIRSMELCLDWFLGHNDVRAALVNLRTGACKDGLHSAGVNQNEGAESTLAWLMVLHRIHQIVQEK